MDIKGLKKTYNQLLIRYYKAEEWFEGEGRFVEDQTKQYNVLVSILHNISVCLKAFSKNNVKLTKEELINGFIEKRERGSEN